MSGLCVVFFFFSGFVTVLVEFRSVDPVELVSSGLSGTATRISRGAEFIVS